MLLITAFSPKASRPTFIETQQNLFKPIVVTSAYLELQSDNPQQYINGMVRHVLAEALPL